MPKHEGGFHSSHYHQERRVYLQELREKRIAAARKKDPKAFDAFWEATFARLFPAK